MLEELIYKINEGRKLRKVLIFSVVLFAIAGVAAFVKADGEIYPILAVFLGIICGTVISRFDINRDKDKKPELDGESYVLILVDLIVVAIVGYFFYKSNQNDLSWIIWACTVIVTDYLEEYKEVNAYYLELCQQYNELDSKK